MNKTQSVWTAVHTCTESSPDHMCCLSMYWAQRHLTHACRDHIKVKGIQTCSHEHQPPHSKPTCTHTCKGQIKLTPTGPKSVSAHLLTRAGFVHTHEYTPMTADSCTEITKAHTLRSHKVYTDTHTHTYTYIHIHMYIQIYITTEF